MQHLRTLLLDNETWLMQRILKYAKGQDYTTYTSTLLEAWRLSISGLSHALLQGMDVFDGRAPEFVSGADLTGNPVAAFGVAEARLHRQRGISLGLFLGLLKYYRQTYQDLVREKIDDPKQRDRYDHFILRCFDLIELALCTEWNAMPQDALIQELQSANRELTNEKNRYLTLFESLSDPAFLLDAEAVVIACNPAAAGFLRGDAAPGELYYQQTGQKHSPTAEDGLKAVSGSITGRPLSQVLPWLGEIFSSNGNLEETVLRREIKYEQDGQSRYFTLTTAAMLDVSGKYEGAVLVLSDITEQQVTRDKLKASKKAFRQLAATDPLTGAHNRRSFIQKAALEWTRSRRYQHPLSVLMIDIDHFKLVNDTYGHDVGDLTLQVLTQACMNILRKNDIFGRLGGEEFAAILVETDEERALQVADRLRNEISELKVTHEALSFSFQISIGAATLKEDDTRVEGILKKADQALYKAKCLGRNMVVAASQLALLP